MPKDKTKKTNPTKAAAASHLSSASAPAIQAGYSGEPRMAEN
jgi:hypothetical protein